MRHVERAIAILGSQQALADAIGAHQAQVSQWARGVTKVPAKYVPAIERATAGAVTRSQLRPDLAAIFAEQIPVFFEE